MKNESKYGEILFFQKVGEEKETLTYELAKNIDFKEGMIIEAPLRNKLVKGVINKIHNKKPSFKTKEINKIIENVPHIQSWQLEIINWMSKYYYSPKYRVLKLFLPQSIIKKKREIKEYTSEEKIDQFSINFKHKLNTEQKSAIKLFNETQKTVSLLHGITGSGKTEIYLNIVEKIIKQNKQVLVLIPEISLSPQMKKRFEDHFNEQTRVIHSKLTQKQKEEAWQSIYSGNTKIIIGSRSSLFAPFKNLGCIIIDEEHDNSYKQDQSPRYNTTKVAEEIAKLLKIKVLMGSATPSIESYYYTKTGKYEHLELKERPQSGVDLPKTEIIDLREEIKKKNYSIFSEKLQNKLSEILNKKEQAILFLNRRGSASAVICRVCGYVYKCKNCEIPMTYHKKIKIENSIFTAERLICHHCGLMDKVPTTCDSCNSAYIKYIGLGTQKIEEEINKIYTSARVIRADRDTTQNRDSFKDIFNAFSNGEADILIGTQMITLGLHLPKVNLVGIILADMGLTLPDFRSGESTFQLITQVAGRAGRESLGHAIIQTYLPEHYAIKHAARHDYIGFYNEEIKIRKELNSPPFSKIIKITIKDKSHQKCVEKTDEITNLLTKLNSKNDSKSTTNKITINTYPALISKLNNTYRWNILLSGQNPSSLLSKLPKQTLNQLIIDVDPLSTL